MKKSRIYFLFMALFATIMAHPAGWSYHQVYEVTENSGVTLSDYQLAITLNTQALVSLGQMQSNGSDIHIILSIFLPN